MFRLELTSAQRTRWITIGIVLAVLAAAAYLRIEGLGRDSVWHDEAHSVLMSRPAFVEVIRKSAVEDAHPPLYYLLLHSWMDLTGGDSGTQLRALSVIFGVLGVLAIFYVAREIGGTRVGVWSAVLLAASVFHVQYSREARMYALLLLLAIVSMYAFLRLGAGTWRRASVWIVVTLAMLLTHAAAVFMMVVQHLCWLLLYIHSGSRQRVPRLGRWIAMNAVLGVLVLPWFIVALRQVQRVNEGFWVPRPYLSAPVDILVTLSGSRWLALGVASLCVVGILWLARRATNVSAREPWPAEVVLALLLIWGAVPVLAPWLWSYIGAPILLPRIAIAGLAPLLIVAAFGINAIRPRWAGAAAGVVLMCAQGAASWSQTQRLTKEDWRGAAGFVGPELQPGDLLLFHQAHRWKALDYYLRRPDADIAGFPTRRFMEGDTVHPEEVAQLDAVVAPYTRVWYVVVNGRDPARLIDHRLEQGFATRHERDFRHIRIRLFQREAGAEAAAVCPDARPTRSSPARRLPRESSECRDLRRLAPVNAWPRPPLTGVLRPVSAHLSDCAAHIAVK